jgi:hypothetical protein
MATAVRQRPAIALRRMCESSSKNGSKLQRADDDMLA